MSDRFGFGKVSILTLFSPTTRKVMVILQMVVVGSLFQIAVFVVHSPFQVSLYPSFSVGLEWYFRLVI